MLSRTSPRISIGRRIYKVVPTFLIALIVSFIALHGGPLQQQSEASPAVEQPAAEQEIHAALAPERAPAPGAASGEIVTVEVTPEMSVVGWPPAGSLVDVLLVGKDGRTLIVESAHVISTPTLTAFGRCTGERELCAVQLTVSTKQRRSISETGPFAKMTFTVRSRVASRGSEQMVVEGRMVDSSGSRPLTGAAGRRTFTLSSGRWVESAPRSQPIVSEARNAS